MWRMPSNQVPSSHVRILKEGDLFAEVNMLTLTGSQTIVVEGGVDARDRSIGRLNVIEIEHGRIRMVKSDCPLQMCVLRSWVSDGGMPVVCLPNRVVVTFEGGTGVDAVVG